LAGDLNTLSTSWIAISPERRITAMPPVPAGVEMAHIVATGNMKYFFYKDIQIQ